MKALSSILVAVALIVAMQPIAKVIANYMEQAQRQMEEPIDLDKTVVLDLFSQDIIHRILCL